VHWRPMMETRRSRQIAELRAALAACQERASVLASERDRALRTIAQLTEGPPAAEPATALHTVGLSA
jgi:alkylhydroperoxidase family enzyme